MNIHGKDYRWPFGLQNWIAFIGPCLLLCGRKRNGTAASLLTMWIPTFLQCHCLSSFLLSSRTRTILLADQERTNVISTSFRFSWITFLRTWELCFRWYYLTFLVRTFVPVTWYLVTSNLRLFIQRHSSSSWRQFWEIFSQVHAVNPVRLATTHLGTCAV